MKQKEFKDDVERLIKSIRDAFGHLKPPNFFENCNSVEDFEHVFGNGYFLNLWEDIYNLEFEEIKYVVPFAIEYYISKYDETVETVTYMELFVDQLIKFDFEFLTIRERYRSIYECFDSIQSNCIYEFLLFIKKYNLVCVNSYTEKGIAFWSHQNKLLILGESL